MDYNNRNVLQVPSVACCVRYSTCSRAAEAGFLNQWAIGDFAVDHRVIRKIGCLVQKSLISVISIGELTKIEDFDALTFFSDTGENCSPRGEDLFFRRSGQKLVFQRVFFEIRAKIALPKVKTFFFEAQGNHLANNADSKVETSFFEAEGHRAMVQQRWSTEQWATQTFKKYKMGHVIEKVENHLAKEYFLVSAIYLLLLNLLHPF